MPDFSTAWAAIVGARPRFRDSAAPRAPRSWRVSPMTLCHFDTAGSPVRCRVLGRPLRRPSAAKDRRPRLASHPVAGHRRSAAIPARRQLSRLPVVAADARSPRAVVNRRGAVSPRDASHAARGANASMRFHARALQPPRASFGGRRSRRTRRSTARARTPATTLVRAEVRKATARAPGESIPALYKNKSRRDSWSARAIARNIDRRGSGRCSFAAVM